MQILEAARAGLHVATTHLRDEIDALSRKLEKDSPEAEDADKAALDVKDAYAIFEAAARFFDVARNQ
jgi:hypothetical protein